MEKPKTFFIRTYGCQMNELDSEIMVGQLLKRGLKRVYDEKEGDLLVFNTCSIRDLAERKVMGKIGQLGRSKKKQMIGVTGCMAMAKKESLFRKLPNVDFVIGTNNITDLGMILDNVIDTGRPQIKTDDQFEENLDYLVAKRDDKYKAHVSIIRGCDKYCTYCVVPYTRGQEVSRPPEDIEKEVRLLADQGYKEITLLGQNVNSYGKDQPEWQELFHDLLYRLDKVDGIERIRFMTSHPIDITRELMEAIRDLPSLCEFVHFPIQAGSSRILKKMHRIYTKEQYFEKVALLKEIVPNVSIGTDIIVGFPTETEEEFEETLEAFRQIRYSVAFLYTYSPRKGTPAMRWKDDIPQEVKDDRLQRLMTLHESITAEERQSLLNQELEVLVERRNRDGQLKGRTRCWKKVIFPGDESLIGTLQNVQIHSYNHQTLIGECKN
ncbi:tRNA (N6-isopentenyl adenosine(37)-C2)-methylthiotransferase MiaB [Candidatus Neptunochlamydia vexilliferae]|uniref:tRNA-2-methylthio-N(6)-dimethylallyladenosine synthase n=1 Tax=Candidatus Neptunichlamydia vexilliferae TaxID=1651774 RepID=A0ABS0AY77_9BACT|nr:tRNA (N6-isopentenyl adenosine(37)-C2)-methylthiotransferase MiaB [Candidatus Neptunochlamydia vexilliferae]MBF5058552.1 tRNA-2-methylthio-N(6)-dimethylallyladenosine synthase [Candidatus Neptunochlamydia vexilliferae]